MTEYVAIYLRLSIEDRAGRIENPDSEQKSGSKETVETGYAKDESNSISNQRKQIREFIRRDPDLSQYEIVEFCDDGCSGTNMERPGMQRLLQEVRANHIRCIIVKDMSRFSRDYIEMGTYLNQIFPFLGIRFISINDHYDSRDHSGSTIELDTAFQTLLYDLYSKDVSVKVKASIESKCANGEYVFGQVPFGYAKGRGVENNEKKGKGKGTESKEADNKDEKNDVIVNEKEAAVVRYIFALALQGKSSTQIARQLHAEGIPTPMQMRRSDKQTHYTWSAQAVRNILNNRFYLGEMSYGKTVRKSVGSRQGTRIPREDWKVIKDHHDPLISEETFCQVSSFRPQHSKQRKRDKHTLTGKLYCGGCGYCMNYKPLTDKNKYRRFECSRHALLNIPDCCTYMRADRLEEAILLALNQELMLRGNAMRQKENVTSFQKAAILSLQKKQKEYRTKLHQARTQKDMLYETYALGTLTAEAYQQQAKTLAEQIALLSVKAEETASKLERLEDESRKTDEDMKVLLQYSHIEELTQDVVDVFVKRVAVYKDKRVEIEWNFGEGKRK